MKKKISFVLLLSILLMLMAPALYGCGATYDAITLYVYNWGEYISDGSDETLDSNAEFEKYCKEVLGIDVKVNYSTF